MLALISAFLMGLAAEAAGPSWGNDTLTAVCATQKCRPARTLTLDIGGKTSQTQQPALPYVVNDAIIVVPGDEFDVEVDFGAEGAPAHVTLPSDAPRKDHTVHVKFEEKKNGLMLMLSNSTGVVFKYDALMEVPDGRLLHTSACPVLAMMGTEMWPHPIYKLILSNLRKMPDPVTMICD